MPVGVLNCQSTTILCRARRRQQVARRQGQLRQRASGTRLLHAALHSRHRSAVPSHCSLALQPLAGGAQLPCRAAARRAAASRPLPSSSCGWEERRSSTETLLTGEERAGSLLSTSVPPASSKWPCGPALVMAPARQPPAKQGDLVDTGSKRRRDGASTQDWEGGRVAAGLPQGDCMLSQEAAAGAHGGGAVPAHGAGAGARAVSSQQALPGQCRASWAFRYPASAMRACTKGARL